MTDESSRPLVLIVDDTPTNIQVLAETLNADYRVKVASSGQAALDVIARQGAPDLILLDVMMPDMDGYEVCHRLKQDSTTMGVPVIFVTARDEAVDEERGLQLGAVDYIAKPFHLPVVKARVHNHIRLKRMADMLESMARIDGLTGIPNRRRFDEALDNEWKRAQRTGAPLSIIMVDVDHFKEYNDHYGHGAGDACLKQVAAILASSVTRAGDLVARYGGEEFVLLIPETGMQGACVLAEQLCVNVGRQAIPHEYSRTSGIVTISAGYASVIPVPDGSPSVLLEEADRMLYMAKHQGRNRAHGCGKEEGGGGVQSAISSGPAGG